MRNDEEDPPRRLSPTRKPSGLSIRLWLLSVPGTVILFSIRINDQWRICFVLKDDGPYEVKITDYH